LEQKEKERWSAMAIATHKTRETVFSPRASLSLSQQQQQQMHKGTRLRHPFRSSAKFELNSGGDRLAI